VVASYSNLSTYFFGCKDKHKDWNNYRFAHILTKLSILSGVFSFGIVLMVSPVAGKAYFL